MDLLQEIRALENEMVYVTASLESLGSDEWEFQFNLVWLPKEHWQAKRRAPHLQHYDSFNGYGGTYSGAWPTIEEALAEGVKYAKEKILLK